MIARLRQVSALAVCAGMMLFATISHAQQGDSTQANSGIMQQLLRGSDTDIRQDLDDADAWRSNAPLRGNVEHPIHVLRQAAPAAPNQIRNVQHAEFTPQAQSSTQVAAYDEDLSFIDREKEASSKDPEDGRELISRLGINLMFVLAFAIGCIFLIRHWQAGRGGTGSTRGRQGAIRVSHVLRLTGNAALHVVNVSGTHFLVAIDSAGIKSVSPLVADFDETSERLQRQEFPRVHRGGIDEPVDDDSSTEIDEKLIKLLLAKSQKHAA